MIQLYIKHTDDNYYLLDLEDSESINYKLTVKDLSDITKIFSPFTQSFNIKATDKNKILCGFVGNEKILRANETGEFDAMVYISGFLFQSGKLSFEESEYEFLDQKTFKTNFASNLTSLTDRLGDLTIQDLFGSDPLVRTQWNKNILRDRLQSVKNITLENGINFKWGVPFISNIRTWVFDPFSLNTVDNIAYKSTKAVEDVNFISLFETRPAVTYMTIMEHLLLRIGTPVICPAFQRPEVKDLFVWCNSEDLILPEADSYPLINYTPPVVGSRYNTRQDNNSVDLPSLENVKWQVTGDFVNGVFKIKRNIATSGIQGGWYDGFDVNLIFNNLVSLGSSSETKIKVILRNAVTGTILDNQEITTNTYTFRVVDNVPVGSTTMLDANGEIFLKFEILPITLLDWNRIDFQTIQFFKYTRRVGLSNRTARATYSHTVANNNLSTSLGGNELNLISILPKMKCVDFLKSFFSTFNISVISTGLPDQSMYWMTPSDIQEVNKPYSKRIVDYTAYVDVATLSKEKANKYNQYVFKHFDSKYYESIYGNGTRFGALTYPESAPAKPTKFEVKTDYSIIKQSTTFKHPNVKTCLGFEKDTPTVLDNGGNRYKPVYDEFTLFYLQPKSLGVDTLSSEYTEVSNSQIFSVLEANFKNSFNGKTLAFGTENVVDDDSLYINYYKTFIELLLSANTYKSEFELTLPPNEIFLNFANLNQGESNIPTGFRPQNEIIIGEQRYSLQDSTIDLTTGKSKLTLLNF